MSENPSTKLRGTVEKIIPAISSEPEKAQIAIEGADDLYKELRIENSLTDASGNEVHLKRGEKVDVKVEAEPQGVIAKRDHNDQRLRMKHQSSGHSL